MNLIKITFACKIKETDRDQFTFLQVGATTTEDLWDNHLKVDQLCEDMKTYLNIDHSLLRSDQECEECFLINHAHHKIAPCGFFNVEEV